MEFLAVLLKGVDKARKGCYNKAVERSIYNGDVLDKTRAREDKLLVINSCGIHDNAKHRTVRRRGREDYTVLFVIKGEFNANLGKEMQVFSEGTLLLYPPKVTQDYFQSEGSYAWVHVTGEKASELIGIAFGEERVINFFSSREIVFYFERMIFHFSLENDGENLTILSDFLGFLSVVERKRKDGETDSERLRPVIVEMNKRIAEPLLLKDYASIVGLSEGRFCHLFKEIMGKSPHAYLLDLRLKRAAEMLLEGRGNVSETTYAVGFSDPLYFSRIFKKRYGVSPKEFLKNRGN